MNQPTLYKTGIIFLITLWFCWGFSYPATKIMLRELDIWTSRTLIMGTAGALLLTLGFLGKKELKVPKECYRDLNNRCLIEYNSVPDMYDPWRSLF